MGTEASKIGNADAGSIASALKFLAEDPGRVKKLMQSIDSIKDNNSGLDNSAHQTNQKESTVDRPKPSYKWQKVVDSMSTIGPLKRVKARWLKYYRTVDRCAESTYDASAFASAPALASALTDKVAESMSDKLSDPIVAQVCKLRVCFKWITINVTFDTDAYFRGRSAKVRAVPINCELGEGVSYVRT